MPPPSLDLGRLLRVDEMVTQASQTEAVRDSAAALVHAYLGLRDEVLGLLEPEDLRELREEFERLFEPLDDPGPFREMRAVEDQMRLAAVAEEALMRLRQIGGWIKGLIRELTLEDTMRLEAEAKARLASKPPIGFRPHS
jgi:hypothetical protein